MLAAWALFHAGEFQKAAEAGLKAMRRRRRGITVANKAQSIYANYLENSEKTKLALFTRWPSAPRRSTNEDPKNANAWYCMAYALGRYSQGISIAKALAQGLGAKVKNALETTIKLAPKHADAHIALGAFHAEVIDKVGSLLGRTQGASKDAGLRLLQDGAQAQPGLGDRDGRVRQRAGDARGRQEDEGSDQALRGRRGAASRRMRWSGSTWRWRRRSWRTERVPEPLAAASRRSRCRC